MTDGGFKSMTRDPDSRRMNWLDVTDDPGPWVSCEKCGSGYRTGGWPWCRGKGYASDHWR